MYKKLLKFSSLFILFILVLTGCDFGGKKKGSVERWSRVVYDVYNTSVTLTMYDEKKLDKVFPSFKLLAQQLHNEMDRDNDYEGINNLKTINDSYGTGNAITVSDNLIEVLNLSIKMGELTQGYFNPAMGTIIDLWEPKFNPTWDSENETWIYTNTDPVDSDITEAMKCVPTISQLKEILIINTENKSVTLNTLVGCTSGVKISLGGIGKGYAMDKLKELVSSKYPNEPALIDGGSSSLHMIGTSPNLRTVEGNTDNYWVIRPVAPRYLQYTDEVVFLYYRKGDTTISTSGNSVNYFELVDGDNNPVLDESGLRVLRTHILNPFTGKSENYYDTVNIGSDADAGVLDALTTALYNLSDRTLIKSIIQAVEEYYQITIDYSFTKLRKNNNIDEIVLYMGQSMKDHTFGYSNKVVDNIIF